MRKAEALELEKVDEDGKPLTNFTPTDALCTNEGIP
jgi:hypothetical protein